MNNPKIVWNTHSWALPVSVTYYPANLHGLTAIRIHLLCVNFVYYFYR